MRSGLQDAREGMRVEPQRPKKKSRFLPLGKEEARSGNRQAKGPGLTCGGRSAIFGRLERGVPADLEKPANWGCNERGPRRSIYEAKSIIKIITRGKKKELGHSDQDKSGAWCTRKREREGNKNQGKSGSFVKGKGPKSRHGCGPEEGRRSRMVNNKDSLGEQEDRGERKEYMVRTGGSTQADESSNSSGGGASTKNSREREGRTT